MNDETSRPDLRGRRVGFIGLGLMGKPMARALAACGAAMTVFSRSPGPAEELAAAGMTAAADAAQAASAADVVVLMLTDTPAVAAALAAIKPALRPGLLVIDMGTTAVLETRRFAEVAAAAGAEWLDAPVSGGAVAAQGAFLTIMAGGSAAAFARALPLFQAMGRRVTHVGGVGAGQVAKAANQVIVGLTIGAVAEALALARAAGVDPALVRDAIRGGFAESRVLELHGQRMASGDFTPGGRATTQAKDMRQALELAAAVGVELPATALSCELYQRLIAQGDGDLDHAALYRLY